MHRIARLGAAALAALAVSAAVATSALGAPKAHAASAEGGAVFVQNDRLEGNQVIAYSRSDEGTLTQVGVYDTGGNGGQLEGSVVDHTASQGALALDSADGLLFAVNAGSNTISVFSVIGHEPEAPSGRSAREASSRSASPPARATCTCSTPVTADRSRDSCSTVGGCTRYPGNHRNLGLPQATPGSGEQFTHTPGQIAFTPDGSKLIVTTKAAGQSVEVFNAHTLAPAPVVTSLPGTVPFARHVRPAGPRAARRGRPERVRQLLAGSQQPALPARPAGHRTGSHVLGGGRGRLLLRLQRR